MAPAVFRKTRMLEHEPQSATQLSIIRQVKFCAGHRLFRHESKCAFFHGHNYRVDIDVIGNGVDSVGRVIDFSVIKKRFQGWLEENWDHAFLIFQDDTNALSAIRMVEPTKYFVMPCNPTAENMAKYLLEQVAPHVFNGLDVMAKRVVVWETDEACAVAEKKSETTNALTGELQSAVVVDRR